MAASAIGAYIALLTPLQLLLTLHLTRIAPNTATSAFGLVTGLGALLALVANPLGGRISDRTAARFGRRRTWILAGALSGCAVLATMAWTTQVWQVALVWCAVQTLLNFQQAATTALMPDQVPEGRRGTVTGILGLAAVVGPLAGLTAVAQVKNPVAQWLIVAGVGAALGALATCLVKERQASRPTGGASPLDLVKSLWFNPARYPALGWAWLVRFLITCALAVGTYNAFFLMGRFEVPADQVGGLVLQLSLVSTALIALVSVVGGYLSDRLRRQKPFVVTAGLAAAGSLVIMAVAPSIGVVFVAMAGQGIAAGLLYSVDTALCVRVLPSSENAGKDLGIVNMANTIPQSLVPFIAPALLALGSFTALYLFLALFGLAGAWAVSRLPEMGREGEPGFAPIVRPAPSPTP
ncbi:MAG: MFS transporter [Bifidobacteriaceae bacterium]|nr:MFS transporter [Bifidobacteriaceae bacterium]